MSEVTQLLQAIQEGDNRATDQLLPIVYDELRRLAAAKMAREAPGQTLQPTALVHEAFLRLVGNWSQSKSDAPRTKPLTEEETPGDRYNGRGYFFAAASEAMRRILVENARSKNRIKRGGDRDKVELEQVELAIESPQVDLIALDDSLRKLESKDPNLATIVKLRYFVGLTLQETADSLGISMATVKRNWAYARAWLRVEMSEPVDE